MNKELKTLVVLIIVILLGYLIFANNSSDDVDSESTKLSEPDSAKQENVSEKRGVQEYDPTKYEKGYYIGPVTENFNDIEWETVEHKKVSLGDDIPELDVNVLKSTTPTGLSGVGDAQYSVDVVVNVKQTDEVLYRFTEDNRDAKKLGNSEYVGGNDVYFRNIDSQIELKDVTNDGIPEILFYAGNDAASSWSNRLHILKYEKAEGTIEDITVQAFWSGGTHDMEWFEHRGKTYALKAEPVWPSSIHDSGSCHYCGKYYLYKTYYWNEDGAGSSRGFNMLKPVVSNEKHGDSGYLDGAQELVISEGVLDDIMQK